MSVFVKTVAVLAVGATTLVAAASAASVAAASVGSRASRASTASVAAPAFAAAGPSPVPVRAVPGMPKTVDVCPAGGFTITSAPHLGRAATGDAGFVYTTNAGIISGQDSLVGHCNSAATTPVTFRITVSGKNPSPVRISYAESCAGSAGSVVFTMTNSDVRRHTVDISAGSSSSSASLTPRRHTGDVPAASTGSVDLTIGAAPAKVSVRIDGGRPGIVQLKGCPAGNGATGLVPGRGSKTGGGFLARHPHPQPQPHPRWQRTATGSPSAWTSARHVQGR
jgi:hypothetical protein